MDPTACLKRFITAVEDRDSDEMKAAAGDLTAWLRKGGFMPTILPADLEFLMLTIVGQAVQS